MVLNGKRMVNGVSSIGRCFNDTIDMTAVFSAVKIRQELADLGNLAFVSIFCTLKHVAMLFLVKGIVVTWNAATRMIKRCSPYCLSLRCNGAAWWSAGLGNHTAPT